MKKMRVDYGIFILFFEANSSVSLFRAKKKTDCYFLEKKNHLASAMSSSNCTSMFLMFLNVY